MWIKDAWFRIRLRRIEYNDIFKPIRTKAVENSPSTSWLDSELKVRMVGSGPPFIPGRPQGVASTATGKKTVLRPQVHQVHRSTVGERRAPHSSSCASRPECKGSRKISSSTNGQVIKTLLPPPPRALWPSELFLVLKKFKKRFFFP